MKDKAQILRRGGALIFALTVLVCGSFLLVARAAGQRNAKSAKDQIVGTWVLVSAQDEKKTDLFGPHPLGMLIFDAAGHFSSQVARGDFQKFAVSDRTKATPEESQAVMRGFIAYFGTYKVNGPGDLSLHITGGSFPNWNGADQKRSFVIKGDEMQYTTLVTSFGGASAHLLWKRATAAN